ncbi:hypothetical protein [Thermoanaerobacter siderophilus]|nr:hypothetical protein [Thermoanaerobacter siderophilus]
MLEFKNLTEKKYIDIFLSTLPYDVLIKPFKKILIYRKSWPVFD